MSRAVCAVVVTRNRKALLETCLRAVRSQTRLPDTILVVDNASTDGTEEMLARTFPDVKVLRLPNNQGGAGGFHEGMKWAFEQGFQWMWVMDDDAIPEVHTLENLMTHASIGGLDVVSPIVVDKDNPSICAFRFTYSGEVIDTVEKARGFGLPVLCGHAHAFLGTLIARGAIERVGLPDKRFFIRGDEVEYLIRLKRAGLKLGVVVDAVLRHPSGVRDYRPVLGGMFHVVELGDPAKNFYRHRNYAYLCVHVMKTPSQLIKDFFKYSVFYLLDKRPLTMLLWLKAAIAGAKGVFSKYSGERVGCHGLPD